LHGIWLLLIGNVQINFDVIWHFTLSFPYLVENRKCWNLTLKSTIMSSVNVDDKLGIYS